MVIASANALLYKLIHSEIRYNKADCITLLLFFIALSTTPPAWNIDCPPSNIHLNPPEFLNTSRLIIDSGQSHVTNTIPTLTPHIVVIHASLRPHICVYTVFAVDCGLEMEKVKANYTQPKIRGWATGNNLWGSAGWEARNRIEWVFVENA